MDKSIIDSYALPSKKRRKIKLRKMKRDSWSVTEQILYVQFLKSRKEIMDSPQTRKENKVFRLMADAVKTRTPIQSKSHHQKLIYKYKTLTNIIEQLSRIITEILKTEPEKVNISEFETGCTLEASKSEPAKPHLDTLEDEDYERQEMKVVDHQRILIQSYCSFFEEFSQDYARIECGIIMDDQRLI